MKGLPWATLFMSISVNSLMSFSHEKTNDCKYSKIYREICELSGLYGEHGISELSTIKQLLDDTVGTLYASWNPGYDKDEYFAKIENCRLLHKRLFIDGIAAYYYTNFNFFEFLEKYNLIESSETASYGAACSGDFPSSGYAGGCGRYRGGKGSPTKAS